MFIMPTEAAAPLIKVPCDYLIQSIIPMRLSINSHMLPVRKARLREGKSPIQGHAGSKRTRILTQVCLAPMCQTLWVPGWNPGAGGASEPALEESGEGVRRGSRDPEPPRWAELTPVLISIRCATSVSAAPATSRPTCAYTQGPSRSSAVSAQVASPRTFT